jgi:putative phosphoribosyl transferase
MFKDRGDSGRRLAERLDHYRNRKGVLVLALPRGGVVTGVEIARAIEAPLDVLIVRKIGFPGQTELAVGAVSETGTVVLNRKIIARGNVSEEYIKEEIARQKREILRRVELYRGGRRLESPAGRTIILVDDGVATGATMKAAISTLKEDSVGRLVVAVPVSPPDTADELATMTDEVVCLATPADFAAVGSYYGDFTQVTDEEVAVILGEAAGTQRD